MPIVTVFGEHAQEYDQWFDRHEPVYQAEIAALGKFVPGKGLSLEVGIGTGRFAVPLRIRFGIDPSRGMLAVARQRGLQVCQAIGEKLPFRNGQFDVVLLVTVICFVDDVSTLFRELRRVLKPSGHLIIGFINRNSVLGGLYESRKETSAFYRDARFYTVEDVARRVQEAGFGSLRFCETLFDDTEHRESSDMEVRDGYGNGAFVVLGAQKT